MSFLEEMIAIVDVSSAEVQECIQSLAKIYVTRTVGKEPRKPSDWARPEEIADCDQECDDCSKMNAFLRHPDLQRHVLSDTWHLRTRSYHFKYFEVDEADGKPVAVTKTLKWWEEQHLKWVNRAANAREAFRKLPQAKFKSCLTHRYDEIMGFRVVKVLDDVPKNASQRQHHYQTRSAVPQKRTRDEL